MNTKQRTCDGVFGRVLDCLYAAVGWSLDLVHILV